MKVTVTHENDRVTVELNPDDLIDLRGDHDVSTIDLTLAGERIAQLQRFNGPIGDIDAGMN